MTTPAPVPLKRLGVVWCDTHHQARTFCPPSCNTLDLVTSIEDDETLELHKWHRANAVRKYSALIVKGKTHPFRQAGGSITGFAEDEATVAKALASATTESVPFRKLVATNKVTPGHLHLMLKGGGMPPRTNTHALESADHPTVVVHGSRFVLADGHHRSTKEWAHGKTRMPMRVVRGLTPQYHNTSGLLLEPDDDES